MSLTNTDMALSVPKIETFPDDQAIIDTFYCEKCYDMIIYFIDECDFLSRKSTKFERSSKKFQKCYLDYRLRFDDLQFVYDELKADKEALDEEFQLLQQKALTSEMSHVTKTTTVNDTKKTSKIILSLDDMKLDEAENVDSKKSKSITLDLDSFDKYFLNSHITLNRSHLQLMFDYLAKMILNRQKNSKIVLVNQTDTKSIRYDSDFDMRKEELLDADEHLRTELKNSRDLNQNLELKIKNLTESNRILTETNFNLVQETTKLGFNLNDKIEAELNQVKEELRHEREKSVKIESENRNLKNEIQQIYETLEIQNQLIQNSENTSKLLSDKDNDIIQLRAKLDQISKEHDDYIFLTDEKIKKLKLEMGEKSEHCFKIEQEMAQLKEQYQMLVSDSQYELSTITEEYRKNLSEAKQRTQETEANKNFELERENLVKQIEELKSKLEESETQKASQKNEFEKLMDQKCKEISAEHEDLVKKLNTQVEELRSKIENSQDECRHYKTELESALNKIINLSTNNTELHNVVSEEEEMMIQDRKTVEALHLEVAELKKCLEQAETESKKLNDHKNRKASEECMDVDMETDEPLILLNETNSELGLLKQQITEKESEIDKLRSELTSMEQSNQKLNSEFGRMKQFFESELAESRSKHAQEVELLNNKINEMNNENISLENELKNEKNIMDTNRQKLVELESKLAENEGLIENFTKTISSLESDKLMVESNKDQESQNCAKLQLEIEILKAAMDHEKANSEQKFVQNGELIQDLESKLEQSKQLIQSLNEKIEDLEMQKGELESTSENHRKSHDLEKDNSRIFREQIQNLELKYEECVRENEAKISCLENQSSELGKSLEKLKSENAEKHSSLESSSEELRVLREKFDLLSHEHNFLRQQKENEILDMNNKLAEWNQRYEQAKSDWDQKEKLALAEIEQIKEENRNKTNELDCLSQRFKTLSDESESNILCYQQKLEKYSTQIEVLTMDLNSSKNKFDESESILENLKAELDAALVGKSELVSKVVEMEQSNDRITHEINSLKTVKSDLEQAHLRLENENMELRQDICRLRSDLQNLRETQDFGVTNSEILNSENEDLLAKLEETRHKLELQTNESNNRMRDFENQVQVLNSKLEEVNQEHEAYVNQTKCQIEQYENDKQHLEKNLTENLEKIKDMESQLAELNQKQCSYSQQVELEITNLKNENHKLDSALKENSNMHENFVRDSEQIILELDQKYESLKRDNEAKKQQMTTEFETAKSKYKSDIDNLQSKVNQYEAQKTELECLIQKLNETHEDKIVKLECTIKDYEKEIESIKLEHETKFCQEKSIFDQTVKQRDEQVEQLKQKICEYEQIKSNLESNLAQFQKEEVLSKQKIDQVQSQLESLSQNHQIHCQETKTIISNLESHIAQQNQSIETINGEKKCLQSQIESLNHQINSDAVRYQAYVDEIQTKLNDSKKAYECLMSDSEQKITSMNQVITEYESNKLSMDSNLKNLNEQLESVCQKHSKYVTETETKMRDTESQLEESRQLKVNAINEKECIIEALNQEICQFKNQIGQLETELKKVKTNADNLNEETVKQLKEQTEKTKEIEAEYKSKVELLQKLNAEMLVKNEQLEKDREKSKGELKSKIDEMAQLEIRMETICQQLEELDQKVNETNLENANLKEMNEKLNLECERTAKERDSYIKTANENIEDINRRNKKKLDKSQQTILGLQADVETLNAQIRDYDSIKSLEMAQLSQKFESREMLLSSECDELRKKCSENEEKMKNLSIDISILENEKSELRSQLINYENQIDGLKQDFGLRFEREIEDLRQRSLEFELKYNDQLSLNKELTTKYDNAYESLVSNELKFKEKLFDLNTELEKSLAKLAESKEMLDKRDTQYADMVKLKEACSNEVHDLQRQICDVLKEKGEMANSLIELTQQLSELKQQRNQEPSGSNNPKNEEEIASLKSQVAKYSKERRAYKEEHSQNKKFKSQIEKQTKEIAKLEETIKEMQETNDFLTRQINNLNDHIYEMSNKENENDSSENGATPLSRKSLGRKSLGNKRLLEIQNESMAMGGTAHESNKSKDFTGDNSSQLDQDANDMGEMTPSSARRLNQCAQQ